MYNKLPNLKILKLLFDAREGVYPPMTNEEKIKYNNLGKKLNELHTTIKEKLEDKKCYNILKLIEKYYDVYTERGSLLDELYYREGVTDGINIMIEVIENNKNRGKL